jgi:hypothetical protein
MGVVGSKAPRHFLQIHMYEDSRFIIMLFKTRVFVAGGVTFLDGQNRFF